MSAVLVHELRHRFGSVTALDGLELAVPEGTVMGLLGPNGAGKTTTVRILSTLVRPDSGEARIAGFDVVSEAHEVRARIGLTGQYSAVDDILTGYENLVMTARLLGMPRRTAQDRARELLEVFDLTDAASRRVKTYSGGMTRRLDLAISLVGRPEVLFLDEPTSGLDPTSRRALWRVVRGLVVEGMTLLLTTQHLEEADALADAITVIDEGRAIASGTPEELKRGVGRRLLEIHPTGEAELGPMQAALRGISPAEPEVDSGVPCVRLPVGDDEAVVAAAVRALDDAGVVVDELHVRRPSLDAVFAALTGESAGESSGGTR